MRIFFITAAFALASSTAGMAGPVTLNDAEMDNIVAGVGFNQVAGVPQPWGALDDRFDPAINDKATPGANHNPNSAGTGVVWVPVFE